MVVALDTDKKTASLLEQYPHPEGFISASQGSFQLLPNGNRLIGWGSDPALSEHAPNGDVLYYARFAVNNFRAFRGAWQGFPVTKPDILAYAQNCSAPTTVYVSWNGATEVESWTLYAGNTTDGGFQKVGESAKVGFETSIPLNNTVFEKYVYAEALDAQGNVLNVTTTVPVWTPNGNLAPSCNATMCAAGKTNYTVADAGTC